MNQHDFSLISSLYRSEAHLPHYLQQAAQTLESTAAAGLSAELVIVANDATAAESELLQAFAARPRNWTLQLLHTPREPLYASWNRGIGVSSGAAVGFWNVDDRRTAAGLVEGCAHIREGCELVEFPLDVQEKGRTRRAPPQFRPGRIHPRAGVGPFFMFTRALYEAAGPFNPHFRIAGDFEWAARPPVQGARCCHAGSSGGLFVLHEGNLSGGRSPLEWVEFNIVLLWRGLPQHLRPVDPDLMRRTWEEWGHSGGAIPPQAADWLWGPGAEERYRRYRREHEAPPLLRRARMALARRGLLHSIEWELLQRHPFAVRGDSGGAS